MSCKGSPSGQSPKCKKLSSDSNAFRLVNSSPKYSPSALSNEQSVTSKSTHVIKCTKYSADKLKTPPHSNVKCSSSPLQTPICIQSSTNISNSANSSKSNVSQVGKPSHNHVSDWKESEEETSFTSVSNLGTGNSSWNHSVTSDTEANGTVTLNLEFPLSGWDDESSDGNSSCSLEIVESDVEPNESPIKRARKRKLSEITQEDNFILNGMGQEIERQLEAKAERNNLSVMNVKSILRSVITDPNVLAFVRRSLKDGGVAVTGDCDFKYEPIITRGKVKELLNSVPDVAWRLAPSNKLPPPSKCQALITQELDEDSDDDEEYKPGEDEPSDNDVSERDLSMETQSPANFETDTESCPRTPMAFTNVDCATQTNWSEDGVFKVPSNRHEKSEKEENIARRTRSKLPLNDTPLEEIEKAFIPPDITPDLYDTTCDNADWEEFLKEFMQPLRSDLESQNNDDDEEDPEYNVLADEEIIDKEELRVDRAVKVSKRELNDLMRELIEYTENLSSDDEIQYSKKNIGPTPNVMVSDDRAILDALGYTSWNSLSPVITSKCAPQECSRSSALSTPVPTMSPAAKKVSSSVKKPPLVGQASACKGLSTFLSPGQEQKHPCSAGKGSKLQVSVEEEQQYALQELVSSPVGKDFKKLCNSYGVSVQTASNIEHVEENLHSVVEVVNTDNTESIGKNMSVSSPKRNDLGFINEEGNQHYYGNDILSQALRSAIESSSSDEGEPPELLDQRNDIEDYECSFSEPNDTCVDASTGSQLSVSGSSDESGEAFSQRRGTGAPARHADIVGLTGPQRLLFEQQMRQHVQLVAQHFLQTYKHPLLGHLAGKCKELLVDLEHLGNENSASLPANLPAALDVVQAWESKLDSEEGVAIQMKPSRQVFPKELIELMADSKAFVAPLLIPPWPFRPPQSNRQIFVTSAEEHLIALCLEEFIQFIEGQHEHEYKHKRLKVEVKRQALDLTTRRALDLTVDHLKMSQNKEQLYRFVHRRMQSSDNPLSFLKEFNRAPPTTHVIYPFKKEKMKPLRAHSFHVLPKVWRDFSYPPVC